MNRGEFGFPKQMVAGSFPPAQAAQEIVAFIDSEMKAGRLRKQDPWLVTRAFVGALQNYVLLEIVTKGAFLIGPVCSPDAYVKGIVDVLWAGIAPKGSRDNFPTGRRRAETLGARVSKAGARGRSPRSRELTPNAPSRAKIARFTAGREPGGE